MMRKSDDDVGHFDRKSCPMIDEPEENHGQPKIFHHHVANFGVAALPVDLENVE